MTKRHAVFLAPAAESALWRFGSAVLGYDAETGSDLVPLALAGFDKTRWRALTQEPRRYGFHGTLKAPFRLVEGADEEALLQALSALGQAHRPFELPPLEVTMLGDVLALTSRAPTPALDDLAACAVRDLDRLRAPLTPPERARRKPKLLTRRQTAFLETYGYPYVLDEFRFHMTLTGPLAEGERERAFNALGAAFAASTARGPLEIGDIALFIQDGPKARFRLLRRIPLGTD